MHEWRREGKAAVGATTHTRRVTGVGPHEDGRMRDGGHRHRHCDEAATEIPRDAALPAFAQPCFFHRDCGSTAEVEKQGKAVCRACARGLNGAEYSLRAPNREPLYRKPEELVLQLEMKEGRRKRGGD